MITLLFGGRAWAGRLAAGLVILGYVGYRLISNRSASLTVVAAALGLGLVVYALWSVRQALPVEVK